MSKPRKPKNRNNKFKDARDKRPPKDSETYVSKTDGKEEKFKFRNHPTDFIPEEEIRKQVGGFSFNGTIGIPLHIDSIFSETPNRVNVDMPSVMEIDTFSSIGAVLGAESIDGINVSGQKYYNILSSMNNKTTQYQPEDISLVEVLIASFMEQVANAIRVYGVVFNFNPRNRNIPDKLVQAMGVAPDSLADDGDVSGYRMRLNRILTKANQVKFIKDLPIFRRSWELNSRIFIDENSSMGQYYVFRPYGFWQLTETSSESRAEWVDRSSLITATELLNDLDNMLTSLLTSSIFNYIYTDMLNYSEKKGAELVSFAYVPELVQVFGVYDQGILNQIHNMTWGAPDLSDYRIIDLVDANRITTTNPYKMDGLRPLFGINGDSILDHIYTDQPTFDDNIDAVAFKSSLYSVYQDQVTQKWTAQGIYLPDHPVARVKIYRSIDDDVVLNYNYLAENDPQTTIYAALSALSAFRVAPMIWSLNSSNGVKSRVISSFNFYTEISPTQLRDMFEYFYLGLYNVNVKDIKPFQ